MRVKAQKTVPAIRSLDILVLPNAVRLGRGAYESNKPRYCHRWGPDVTSESEPIVGWPQGFPKDGLQSWSMTTGDFAAWSRGDASP